MRRGICRKLLLPAAVGTLSMVANAQYLSNQNAMNMDSTDIGRLMQLSNMGQMQPKVNTTSTTHNAGRVNWAGKCGASNGSLLPREPDTFLCDSGGSSGVSTVDTEGQTFYKWSCTGSSGAATSCQAQQRTDGVCGSSNGAYLPAAPTHMCSSGVPSQLIKIGNQYIWYCQGNYGPRKECTAIYAPDIPLPTPPDSGTGCPYSTITTAAGAAAIIAANPICVARCTGDVCTVS